MTDPGSNLRRRQRKERLFRAAGFFATGVGVLFLGVFFTSLVAKGASVNLADIRQLMTLPDPPQHPVAAVAAILQKLTGIDINLCPCCKKGKMQLHREIPKGSARPPNPLAYAVA